ncbi:MAG: MBL fold metallo-hydrolase [Anaerolineales bacterium]|jgi:metallo-beta-lactamase family protein|nr:MBL fold metallo-hydrolase [Anaerolineales bacterium]
MRIYFNGAAKTVTGTQHCIEVNGSQLLLDCGMYQGKRSESYERNHNFRFKPSKLDAVILSHAHIDHSGNLPNLVKKGYTGPIFGTPATCHLADLMLRDSGHIQEAQAENINFHRARRGELPVEPLYTEEDAAQVENHFRRVDYNQPFEPIPGVIATLYDAGHILGSASVHLEIDDHGTKRTLWFSGDIGRRKLPIIRDPVLPPEPVDYMIMECTYGDKPHRDPEQAYIEMRDVILQTLGRGGKVIVPAFAVGRTQEIVYNLNRMYMEGVLDEVPVYVDSPLAVNASEIFKQHPECYDKEMLATVQSGHPALDFRLLTYVQSLEESKELNHRRDPMVVISASGMAETGRVVYHIKFAIENKNNTILIVSWQSPETLGRRLADRELKVRIMGEPYTRKAEVATIGGLSAHAGQDFLLEYVNRVQKGVNKVFLVHGEEKQAGVFMEKLKEIGFDRYEYPEQFSRFDTED